VQLTICHFVKTPTTAATLELNAKVAVRNNSLKDLSSDGRCVDGAQFPRYTKNDPDKPWQADDVKNTHSFLASWKGF
jgi:hypothetical protein